MTLMWKEKKFKNSEQGNLYFLEKSLFSLAVGSIGFFVGTLFDLVIVRMQADKRPDSPDEMRRNYKNVQNAFNRIIKEEKFKNLWISSYTTIIRASMLNLTMMVSYDETKGRLS